MARRVPSSAKLLSFFVLFLLAYADADADADTAVVESKKDQCVYTFYVSTGRGFRAGTDSKIGLTLGDASGGQIRIDDLEAWGGAMAPNHDYFERGNLDIFTGRGPCGVTPPLCRLNLTSDGTGPYPGWYCEYVQVTATGPLLPCATTIFYVGQWLAIDESPYQLYAYLDGCDLALARVPGEPFVVGDRPDAVKSSAAM